MAVAESSVWRVVVPIKDRFQSKTRLRVPEGVLRENLALAMALDTLAAVYEVVPPALVFVVTDDDQVTAFVDSAGGNVVRDPGRGLNPAIAAGIAASTPDDVEAGRVAIPGAVLLGDLPSLTAVELISGLRACAVAESSVIPDRDGTGTVLLTHHDLRRISPRFGGGSAARHGRVARTIIPDLPRLRTDVDTENSLAEAIALGVGKHTTDVLGSAASVG